jgi:hypothetical protein
MTSQICPFFENQKSSCNPDFKNMELIAHPKKKFQDICVAGKNS